MKSKTDVRIISIIQRAGIVPLSIAGIFKEVSTISVSAWVFGDELTKLNILGVFVTICGKRSITSCDWAIT
jgi:solute carrier family 35 protein C2